MDIYYIGLVECVGCYWKMAFSPLVVDFCFIFQLLNELRISQNLVCFLVFFFSLFNFFLHFLYLLSPPILKWESGNQGKGIRVW